MRRLVTRWRGPLRKVQKGQMAANLGIGSAGCGDDRAGRSRGFGRFGWRLYFHGRGRLRHVAMGNGLLVRSQAAAEGKQARSGGAVKILPRLWRGGSGEAVHAGQFRDDGAVDLARRPAGADLLGLAAHVRLSGLWEMREQAHHSSRFSRSAARTSARSGNKLTRGASRKVPLLHGLWRLGRAAKPILRELWETSIGVRCKENPRGLRERPLPARSRSFSKSRAIGRKP